MITKMRSTQFLFNDYFLNEIRKNIWGDACSKSQNWKEFHSYSITSFDISPTHFLFIFFFFNVSIIFLNPKMWWWYNYYYYILLYWKCSIYLFLKPSYNPQKHLCNPYLGHDHGFGNHYDRVIVKSHVLRVEFNWIEFPTHKYFAIMSG